MAERRSVNPIYSMCVQPFLLLEQITKMALQTLLQSPGIAI